jgi:hypothetical protein
MPILKLLNWGLQVSGGALSSGTLLGDNLKVKVLKGFDESFDELFEKIASVVPCIPEKDAMFLRWRYGPSSPQALPTILGVRDEEGLLGYAVLQVPTVTRGGFRDANILDLTSLPGRRDVTRVLLREAIHHFRRAGAQSVKCQFLDSPTSPRRRDLLRLGFFLSSKRRDTLLVKFADRSLHRVANDIVNWSYCIGDGEASFWTRL